MPSYGMKTKFKPPKVSGYGTRNPQVDGYLQAGMHPYAPAPTPKPPAPKPPAPPAPKPQALPFDPMYESTVGNARRQYDTTLAGLQYQEGRVKQQYGWDDPSDPFSAAAMLQRNFHQSQRGRLNTAGNNLYSSSFGRNEDQARFGYEQNVDSSRKAYADALQDIVQKRNQALVDRDSASSTAKAESIYRAQQDRESMATAASDKALNDAQIAALNRQANPPKAAPKPKPKPKAKPKPKGKKSKKAVLRVRIGKPKKKGY